MDLDLDKRTAYDIALESAERLRTASNGVIDDFSVGTPQTALLTTQAWLISLYSQHNNGMVVKIINRWLEVLGVSNQTGVKSTGVITLETVSSPSNQTLKHPQFFTDGDQLFTSYSDILIPPNTAKVNVPVSALETGLKGDVPAYSIQSMVSPSVAVKSVYNPLPLKGGRDPDSDLTIALKTAGKILRRGLLRSQDLIDECKDFLGRESLVYVRSEVTLTTITATDGNRYPLSTDAILTLQNYLSQRLPSFIQLEVQTVNYLPVYVVYDLKSDIDLSEELWGELGKFELEPGEPMTIDHLRAVALIIYKKQIDNVEIVCDYEIVETLIAKEFLTLIPQNPILKGELVPPSDNTIIKITGVIVNTHPTKKDPSGYFKSYLRGSITGDTE